MQDSDAMGALSSRSQLGRPLSPSPVPWDASGAGRRLRGRRGGGRGAVPTIARKEDEAAQVNLAEAAQASGGSLLWFVFAGFAAPLALAGWPRRPASLLRADMRRYAGKQRGSAQRACGRTRPACIPNYGGRKWSAPLLLFSYFLFRNKNDTILSETEQRQYISKTKLSDR